MKITIRLIVSLVFVVALVAIIFSFYQVRVEHGRLVNDLERRTVLLAESLQESVKPLSQSKSFVKLNRFVERFGNRERLKGIVVCNVQGDVIASTPALAQNTSRVLSQVLNSISENRSLQGFINIEGKKIYTHTIPFSDEEEGQVIGALTLFQDASYIDIRLKEIWKHNLIRFLILTLVIVVITLLVVRWSITGPIAQIAEWMRELRLGNDKSKRDASFPRGDVLAPLVSEVSYLAKSLSMAQKKAEEEAQSGIKTDSLWTADKLKEHVHFELGDKKLFLISNREPYMHIKEGRSIQYIIPAGGLVTALDPVMRVCNGVWIAHGGGDGDRDVVDEKDTLRVPPEQPCYTLKRIWLTKEEENGYYYGFSNEGVWPLCHITHERPIFRLDDWTYYQRVNEKFAISLLDEIKDEESPLVLVQDYHFALLPFLIKEKRPDVKLAIFWHIPWPNPETYGICPWVREILLGMLGADIIGFHIQLYCNNFLDTVDRFLESKIDWEQFSISRRGHMTLVKPFPISIDSDFFSSKVSPSEKHSLKENLLKEMDVNARYMGVGVDRIDYTKGIPERFRALERFFEKYPEFIGSFVFVELGAPSRTHIKRYRDLLTQVEEAVDNINWRFQTKNWKPVIFLKGNHPHDKIRPFYKAADICMVTSLHDGMNLVAKEFVASCDDEDGVLILSQFTGAARELKDALIVNPYDIESMADAIYMALKMDPVERSERMGRMRATIQEQNIYRWAGSLITELTRVRST
ncbi:MAG: trehalose-6-phosphate synthase [Syntrophorhabdaceae bacterium]|nr:trehalose-6-phosphate synthase [Syntrophorhabdaceae bacterium]